MVPGMSLATFTVVHVVISVIGIVAGFVAVYGMLKANKMPVWTAVFLVTTILTSVTGFMFPFTEVKPSHIFGFISLPLLALASLGYYVFHLAGRWRWIYVITAVFALYLNTFVLIVQSFQKVPLLQPLAPTQSEPPFAVAQLILLVACIGLGYLAVKSFRPGAGSATLGSAGA